MSDQVPETQETPKEALIHNLFTRPVVPLRNWNQWLARWQSAESIEEMLGLLHCGFDVPISEGRKWGEKEYNYVDRILFYLTIADGWADAYLLESEEEKQQGVYSTDRHVFGYDRGGYPVCKQARDLRKIVAQKAWNQLCLNFFRHNQGADDKNREGFRCIPDSEIISERLFQAIINFFRPEERRFSSYISIRNLERRPDSSSSHHQGLAVEFLLEFVKLIWKWEKGDPYFSDKDADKKAKWESEQAVIRARLDAAKPWAIEILAEIEGGLALIEEMLLTLEEPCLEKLKEIALRTELEQYRHSISETRKVATLDEACYVGSRSAWLLKKRELKLREGKRLQAIRDAERAKKEADRRIKELSSAS